MTPPGTQAEILLQGSKGPAVTALKKQLHAWYDKNSPGEWEKFKIAENDVFGAGVDKAVRRFQAWAALTIDGEVGPQTLAALKAKPAKVNTAAYKDLVFPGALREKATGGSVRLVQGWLTLHGFNVVVDGGFGAATTQALRAFQAKRGLPTTGIVDEATYAALVAPMAAALAPIPRKKTLGEPCSPTPASTSASILARSEARTAARGCDSSPTARKATGFPGAQALRPSA